MHLFDSGCVYVCALCMCMHTWIMYMHLFCLILFFDVKSHTIEKEMKGAEEKKLSLWLNSNRESSQNILLSPWRWKWRGWKITKYTSEMNANMKKIAQSTEG